MTEEMKSIDLVCDKSVGGCGREFFWSVKEQIEYAKHEPAWKPPKRCFDCRNKRRAEKEATKGRIFPQSDKELLESHD